MKKIGHIHSDQFPVFIHRVGSYNELRSITLPSRHSVILLAGDADGISTDIISGAADHLLASGLSYICTWGRDCERVHDLFDLSYVGDGTTEPTENFMSTWHSSDSRRNIGCFFIGRIGSPHPPAHASPQRHANGLQITSNLEAREALERSELVQQNGCMQRLVWHLSCHRRFPLAVA